MNEENINDLNGEENSINNDDEKNEASNPLQDMVNEIEEEKNDEEYDNAEDDEEMKEENGKKRGCCLGCGIVFLIIIGFFAAAFYFSVDISGDFNKGIINHNEENNAVKKEVIITVEEGETLREISKRLEEEGIAEKAFIFELMARGSGLDTNLQPGTYTLNNYMQFDEIDEILQNSAVLEEYNIFTVIEGDTQEEIAAKLEKEGIISSEEFISACNTGNFDYEFLNGIPERESRLEGYLFPDTYYFTLEADADEIINKMLSRFDEIFTKEMRNEAQKRKISIDDAVIMASIIEGEVQYPPERAKVAAVIYNRLELGMRLQMDATVLYAKGEHSERVWEADTQIESEYNTYYVDGLPKGPIGNPGEDCLKAALYPEDADYLYYVVSDTQSGQHFFTDDYNEFLAAKDRYVRTLD